MLNAQSETDEVRGGVVAEEQPSASGILAPCEPARLAELPLPPANLANELCGFSQPTDRNYSTWTRKPEAFSSRSTGKLIIEIPLGVLEGGIGPCYDNSEEAVRMLWCILRDAGLVETRKNLGEWFRGAMLASYRFREGDEVIRQREEVERMKREHAERRKAPAFRTPPPGGSQINGQSLDDFLLS